MTRTEFLDGLSAILEVDPASVQPGSALAALGSWDSLAQIAVIAMVMESFSVQPNPQRLAECQTVQDLLEMFQGELQ